MIPTRSLLARSVWKGMFICCWFSIARKIYGWQLPIATGPNLVPYVDPTIPFISQSITTRRKERETTPPKPKNYTNPALWMTIVSLSLANSLLPPAHHLSKHKPAAQRYYLTSSACGSQYIMERYIRMCWLRRIWLDGSWGSSCREFSPFFPTRYIERRGVVADRLGYRTRKRFTYKQSKNK